MHAAKRLGSRCLPDLVRQIEKFRNATGLPWTWRILLFCCACSVCLAQRYSFRDYTQGLENLNVNCIAQDTTGYLWIGTENGLYRYDGSQFRNYGASDGLNARVIQDLYVDPDRTLWVGTPTGIYFLRPDGTSAAVAPPLPLNEFVLRIGSNFTSMAPGKIVAATRGGAFLLHRTAYARWEAEPLQIDGAKVWSVLATPDGKLWYGCDSDLCELSH